MKKFNSALLLTVFIAGLLPATLFAQVKPEVLKFYQDREALVSPRLKTILTEGRQLIAARHLTFTIANTSVSERDIKTLTGDYKIVPSEDLRIKNALNARVLSAENMIYLKNFINLLIVTASSPAYDPRNENKLPAIRDQKCGDCWAYSSVGAFEVSEILVNKIAPAAIDLSERQMVTCSKAGSCSGGWPYLVYQYLENGKINMMTEAQYPDNGQDGPCPNIKPATNDEIVSWGLADPGAGLFKIAAIAKIKEAIVKYGSVSACVNVTSLFQHYSGGVFNETPSNYANPGINHAIVLVGWDDSKKAWLLRNSWGTGWGEQGYMWIAYNSNNIGFGTIWCVAKK